MATDFASYMWESLTPEQQEDLLVANANEIAANGGIPYQAPQLKYLNSGGHRLDPVAIESSWNDGPRQRGESLEAYTQRVYQANPEAAANVGQFRTSTPRSQGLVQADGSVNPINAQADLIRRQGFQTQQQLDNLAAIGGQTTQKNEAELALMRQLIADQQVRDDQFSQQRLGLAGQLGGYRDSANAAANQSLGNYRTGLQGLNAQNDAAIGQLQGVYGELGGPRTSTLTSQAAIADPQALAAQNQALGMLGATAGGALDYQSQGAQAYADPKYIAMRDQGLADLYEVAGGSKDVRPGELNPQAYASAMEALDKAAAGTNPAVSEAENYLFEQARQAWEMEERGLAAARMSDLRRRGMAGGGAELTSGALASQQIAQQRVLSDLAAAAKAVDRSTQMLELQGALSTRMDAEANAMATGNKNRQLQALGLYQQGAETAQQSSFDQAYKRGIAADNASANNQQTRLQGQLGYANQANAMQDDAFNRNSAADAMAMYNQNFDQSERNAYWGRSTDLAGMTLNKNAQNSNNLSNIFGAEQSVTNNNYQRDRDVISGYDIAFQTANNSSNRNTDRSLGVGDRSIAVNDTDAARQGNVIGMNIGAQQWQTAQLIGNYQQQAAGQAADQARIDAAYAAMQQQKTADKSGFLGTPIGAKNGGIFSGFGAFYDEPTIDDYLAPRRA